MEEGFPKDSPVTATQVCGIMLRSRQRYIDSMMGLIARKILSAMVSNDMLSVVNTRPLKFWKEILALICIRYEWTMICDIFASKLMGAGNTLAATLCYMCAGKIDKTVEIWSQSMSNELESKSYVDL